FDRQIDHAVERFLDEDYGAATFAEFVSKRLGEKFEADDFRRADYAQAEKLALDRAIKEGPTRVQDALDENLGAEDAKEWNWQALAHQFNTRYGLKTTDRQLKQMGKDAIGEFIIAEAIKSLREVDLSEGQQYLASDWGLRSLADWARLKFQIALEVQELEGKSADDIKELLHARILDLYHEKEIEFPIMTGILNFMSDSRSAGGQKTYNREGLYRWAVDRFPQAAEQLKEDDFRTQSRQHLQDKLLEISKASLPAGAHEAIDQKLEEGFGGAERATDADDVRDLGGWAKAQYALGIAPEGPTNPKPAEAPG